MKYIAFLRAINVGGRFVKMDRLRELFQILGYSNVETYIQSGNVLFDSAETDSLALENSIEAHLQTELGFSVPTFIRTGAEMAVVAEMWPFGQPALAENESAYVSFLKSEPDEALRQKMAAQSTAVDEFHVVGKQLYWLYRRHQGESKMTNNKVERVLKVPATRRNTTTVRKIAALF